MPQRDLKFKVLKLFGVIMHNFLFSSAIYINTTTFCFITDLSVIHDTHTHTHTHTAYILSLVSVLKANSFVMALDHLTTTATTYIMFPPHIMVNDIQSLKFLRLPSQSMTIQALWYANAHRGAIKTLYNTALHM